MPRTGPPVCSAPFHGCDGLLDDLVRAHGPNVEYFLRARWVLDLRFDLDDDGDGFLVRAHLERAPGERILR
jgi:hypothetical protein